MMKTFIGQMIKGEPIMIKRLCNQWKILIFVGALILSACEAAGGTPAPPAEETPASEPAADCPEATADTALYTSEDNGYCLLYPASFTVEPDMERPDEVLLLVGPRVTDGQEFVEVRLRVAFNGPAEGLDTQEYADMWQSLYVADVAVEMEPATVGGQPAVLISGLPGMVPEQSAFVVANGMKYQLILQPQPEAVAELTEAANEVWATVTESIVFFEPAVVPEYIGPEEVCPEASDATQLHINRRDGFCFLYPAGFEPDERFDSGFAGGPVIVDDPDFGPIRASLVFASAGPAQDQTPRQALEPRLEFVDPDSVQEITIGGAPAVTFVDPREPYPSRQAMIVANDQLYTIVNQPYNPETYPEAQADVDLIWDTVIDSVAFFDPWR